MERKEAVLKVRDLMTKNLISIETGESVIEAARLMDEKEISSVLVKEGKEFLGIITDRDIIGRVVLKGTDPRKVRVSEVMSSPLITISEGASVEEAAEKMRNNKIRRLVVEENQKILGIIAEADMIRVAPELHFLIRERSKLEVQLIPTKPHEMTFAGFCEDCGNYSNDLRNVSGEWLCEECSHYARA
jgi:CBS domain-containing protein